MSILSSVGCPRLPHLFFDGVSGCHLFLASFGVDFGRFISWCDVCVFIRIEIVNVNDSEGGWERDRRDGERRREIERERESCGVGALTY